MQREISSFADALGPDRALLTFNRGIEREALRVSPGGQLAQTPHPEKFGSKLTHPQVTTDFSESQLELITPVHASASEALADLDRVHRYVYTGLGDEILWSASMPCVLQDNASIPLAYYGESNTGRLKTVYRSGLGLRYGRGMQTICAVHYNFSLSEDFLSWLQQHEASTLDKHSYRSSRYFDLMRNFRRYSWLLTYLFGASPAVCNSFVRGRDHNLQSFDEGTSYLPHATSLRSGNLGYQSDTQAKRLKVCYNSLENYVHSLADAITTPHEPYAALGLVSHGEYQQVNTSILQSEAEFYSSIRAKRVPGKGENFLASLMEKGVEYIEVRLLDVNPYLPLGIDESTIHFIDTFLLYCLVTDSPPHDDLLCGEVSSNALATVYEGRKPGLLLSDQGQPRELQQWGRQLLQELEPLAALLDQAQGHDNHKSSLGAQIAKIENPEKTPSGAILADLTRDGVPFFRFAMNQALQHREAFRSRPLPESELAAWDEIARQSVAAQQAIEAADQVDFEDFLRQLASEYQPLRSGT